MELAFWLSAAFVGYVYVGYPALLYVWASRVASRRVADDARGMPPTDVCSPLPSVSIVVAAHNEGPRLAARIDNLRSLDYPPARRQIVIVSDGSTDDTHEVLARHARHVDAVMLPRGGKALALNAGVARARFNIVVFADARQPFAPDALRELVRPLRDPQVGAVTGELFLDCEAALFDERRVTERRLPAAPPDPDGGPEGPPYDRPLDRRRTVTRRTSVASTIADGVGMYWRYEKALRRLESAVGSTLGATGAIYAIRKALWRPLPADTVLDDVLTPMRVVLSGYRVVFNDKARAFDRAPRDAHAESRRKIRTLAGNYQILRLEPALLLPWRNPVWLQYTSHKVGRLLVPYAVLTIIGTSIALADGSLFYLAALGAEVAFFLLAGYGALVESRSLLRTQSTNTEALPMPARETA
jgi:cellulose synthase/poly-beta-1,6-N-acetylglucosamine synthase-like glycosyltransferase